MAQLDRRDEQQVLVLAPTPSDGELCQRFLTEAGIASQVYEDQAELCAGLIHAAGALVVTEESLHDPGSACIREALADQEDWSALPVVILTRGLPRASLRILEDYERYGRVTLIERPLSVATFVGMVKLALSERRQQYRIRDLLAERTERIRQRDEFLATLGHELRNPLAAIMTCSDVLELVGADTAQAARCHEVVRSQARQIKRLLDDLLDVSRMTRRKLHLQREPVDLRQVLRDTIDQVAGELHEHGQVLDVDLPETPLPLHADPTRLRQVFANLLNNASRYSPEDTQIRLSAACEAGLAEVRVRDRGIGMTPETVARLFEPFYQANDAGQGSPAGLGVGLALARSLVEMHAGTIYASSPGPGQGSEITVRLPLHAESAATRAGPEQTATGAENEVVTRRILLIEDNREYGIGLQLLLQDRGHQVRLAENGAQGIQAAQQERPEVVLLDISLPDLDGYEVARRLRRLPGLAGIRLIVVTGHGLDEDKRRSESAGIDRHLVKPIPLRDLEAAIDAG